MAIQSNTEWKTESAFLAIMAAWADLATITGNDATAITFRRWQDLSQEVTYPCVIVDAQSMGNEPFGNITGYDQVEVEIECLTARWDDATGQLLSNIMGAVRDMLRDDDIYVDLTAAVNEFNVYGIDFTQPSYREMSADVRRGTFNLTVHATSSNVDNSSSSTSSG